MINLDIAGSFKPWVNPQLLLDTIRATLQHQKIDEKAGLSLVVRDDTGIQELNRTFRGIDQPTDVLAFPSDLTDPDTGELYLGDVLISYPQAEAQAKKAGHSIDDELRLLTVHGVLHLLDFDHLQPDDKASMWAAQSEILDRLGSTVTLPD
jgi:probable rRNA maturation factor